MAIHKLKTETKYFQLSERGLKNFEIRFDDRYFTEGDIVYLVEIVRGVETGRELVKKINYIFKEFPGIKYGYVILFLKDYY